MDPLIAVAMVAVILSGIGKYVAVGRESRALRLWHFQSMGLGRLATRARRALGKAIFPVALASLVAMNSGGSLGVAHAAGAGVSPHPAGAGAGVSGAVTFAESHWQWAIYDNSLPQVYSGGFQPQFQCAEFVARSLASSGPIGALSPTGPATDYANVTYSSAIYNLNLVSGLYHFLLATGVATDVGTSLSSATLGSVIIYGNTQDGDFLHTAIVTNTTNAASPLFTSHNRAYDQYPGSTVMYDEYGRQMPITHILQINYGLIAGGALQSSVGGVSGSTLLMTPPAPYEGGVITSGVSLSWQAVTGAQTYNVALYDVNGRLIDGLSTATTAFSYNLSAASYGVYDYTIQPESSSASFPLFADEFNYESPACLTTGATRNVAKKRGGQPANAVQVISANSTTSCSSASGTAATSLMPTLSPTTVGMTSLPNTPPPSQAVTITNGGTAAYNWILGKEPSWVTVLPNTGSLAPGATVTLSVNLWDQGAIPSVGTYTTTLQFYDMDGIYAPLSLPVSVVVPTISMQWYFAEGYTGGSFTEYLTLANPGASNTDATVTVQYLLGAGSPITQTYTVAGGRRSTINVNNAVGPGQNVSMVVTSDLPIVAERPMYFTYTGLKGYTIPGGSDVLGATSLGTQFDFGYLDTSPGHATYLTILNPNSSAVTATVNYYAAAGGAPKTITHTIAANSRGTVNVNNEGLAPGSYSALVTLSAPGLVERPMYFVDSLTGYTGAANVVGVTQPLTAWYFAEGYTNTNFSERYILSNPSASATAHATVTFYKSDGTTATASVTLSPGQQQVVNANNVLGADVNNSASVMSDNPILAERFMSFTYTGPVGTAKSSSIPGATDVLGAAAPGYAFYFAEGNTGGSFGEYLTLENPNTSAAHVTVTYLPQNGGAPTVVAYTVNPTSRYTILTNPVMPSQSFSMAVVADQPIVAERPMYFNYGSGQTGATDVVGYQPVAPIASPPPSWNIEGSANPAYSENYLYGVAAVSTNDVWTVGRYIDPITGVWEPLIEHWDGTHWSVVVSPEVDAQWLNAVVAISASNVWAVGAYGLIEHWDGASWTVVANPGSTGTFIGALDAVSAISPTDVWAVGYYVDSSVEYAWTEHWDGSSWTTVSNPASSPDSCPGVEVALSGVTAIASNDVWTVGYESAACGSLQALTEHWDGSSWTIVSNPGGTTLSDVVATATNNVWAVGSSGNAPLVEHWDGTSWGIVSTPTVPVASGLNAIAIVSPTDIWAAGATSYALGSEPLMEHWDGTSWSIMQIPSYNSDSLAGLATISTSDVWVVGTWSPIEVGDWYTFTEHYGS